MAKYASPGRSWQGSALRAGVGMAAVALVAAACGSPGSTSAAAGHAKSPMPKMSSEMPMPSPSMSMGGGMLPMGAKHMHVAITSPMTGMKVADNSVTVHVQVSGNAKSIMFDYAPATPLPAVTSMMMMGKPSVSIVSPKTGATVAGNFTV